MDEKFRSIVEALQPKLDELLGMVPIRPDPLPAGVPLRGVYLLSERERHLYVGRSNKIPIRLRDHCGGTHKKAAFAFKLAREATGCTNPTYQRSGSRDELMTRVEFVAAFQEAQARTRILDLRYVQEDDPLKQCLLEFYVSVVLATPYNGWDTT
ncbi:MAG: GIY-YIG nuclease family protein [Isosphaeraceae bacterium]